MGKIIATLILGLPLLDAVQPSPLATAPSTVARRFLDALQTSDFDQLRSLTVPDAYRWFKENFDVLFSYKVLREGRPCAETVQLSNVRTGLVSLFDLNAQQRTADWLALFGQLTAAYPCLAKLINVDGLPRTTLDELVETATFSVHETIVDVERPGRTGTRLTERRTLTLVNVRSAKIDTGWRVGAFERFQP